jgi:hypothetical protein
VVGTSNIWMVLDQHVVRRLDLHVSCKGKVSYMVVDRNGLPWDRATEEGAQEWVQWLHPRDEDRPRKDNAPNICANIVFPLSENQSSEWNLNVPRRIELAGDSGDLMGAVFPKSEIQFMVLFRSPGTSKKGSLPEFRVKKDESW